ncbi:MAG: hypothetical protein IPJ88_13710 [Myxococcales bacterium]|nr:MAG: hypothetical protein IPJ88_13710 [Myxococcales bacterium]
MKCLLNTLLLLLITSFVGESLAFAESETVSPTTDDEVLGVRFSFVPAPKDETLSKTEQHYRFVAQVELSGWPAAEVVADRRLLSLLITPEAKKRSLRCVHPEAPRGMPDAERIKTASAEGHAPAWREWVDLRMYCNGRALKALQGGATVQAVYGWKKKNKSKWIARSTVDPEIKIIALESESVTLGKEPEQESSGAVKLSLRSSDRRDKRGLSFQVAVFSPESSAYVYLRPDLYRFSVKRGEQTTLCGLYQTIANPIRDFFQKLGGRRRIAKSLDVSQMCPELFNQAGIYEVSPMLDLPYEGESFGLKTFNGSFQGPAAVFRIRRGDGEYVEQLLNEADSQNEASKEDSE